jgi:hypothetical protein
MLSKQFRELPANRAVILENVTCPYCAEVLNASTNTKEHIIGRRFVPKGSLDRSWNLIVCACRECNSEKSILENDISAITQVGKHWFGRNGSEEEELGEAQRKARRSTSKKTGKPVLNSQEEITIKVPFGPGALFTFNMVAPPQIDQERIFHLARMQMMAFFYFITYDHETKRGRFWPEGFYLVSVAHHGDWGNSLQRAFMSSVVSWEPCWIGNAAKGYFKSIIRRHPSANCWSWALEWNNNYRVIGFFGNKGAAQALVDGYQKPNVSTSQGKDGTAIGFRNDVPLGEDEDCLFGGLDRH